MSKLNFALANYKDKIDKKENLVEVDQKPLSNKNRILTHFRNELISISVDEIAYIFMENGITYLKTHEGNVSNTNSSLDELCKTLGDIHFFRANRQFILSVSAISKILKYGNKQLKIEVKPISDLEIIISKHKATDFKNWFK